MIFSQEEVLEILKKNLPEADYKNLNNVAQDIINQAQHWQEADLNQHIHDDVEEKILHDICQRTSKNNQPPKKIRLFFKD